MATCINTDITSEQSNDLKQTIQIMVAENFSPYTIVDYVCAELGISSDFMVAPETNHINWCLLECISSQLFKNVIITPTTFTYTNTSTLYANITTCFPQRIASSNSGSSGGGSCAGGRREGVGNCNKWKSKSVQDLANRLGFSTGNLTDLLTRAFAVLSVTCQTYAFRLAMLGEHALEAMIADITKRIGTTIDWISRVWKMIKDMLNSSTNLTLSFGITDTIAHIKKSFQDAITTIQGYLSDIMKNAGQYIEQIGELLNDLADRMWNLKDIADTVRALSAMVNEVYAVIDWANSLTDTVSKSTDVVTNFATDLFSTQLSFTVEYADTIDTYKLSVGDTINNQSQPPRNIINSVESSVKGVMLA